MCVCDLLILYGYNSDVFWYFVGGDLNCVKKDNLICGSGKMC